MEKGFLIASTALTARACSRVYRLVLERLADERGMVAVLVVAGAAAIFGSAALSVDVGRAYVVKQRLQDVADAAGLAGARYLPDDSCGDPFGPICEAEQAALDVVAGNGVQATVTVTFPDADSIRVVLASSMETALARVLSEQLASVDISAASLAGGGGPSSLSGMSPWKDSDGDGAVDADDPDCLVDSDGDGLMDCEDEHPFVKDDDSDYHCDDGDDEDENCRDGWDRVRDGPVPLGVEEADFVLNQPVSLKVGAGDQSSGNFHALAFGDERGAGAFENSLKYGFHGTVALGDELDTEPGNMKGPSRKAVEWRIGLDPAATHDNVRRGSPRVVYLSVVTSFQDVNGRDMVRVNGFAAFFIEGFDQGGGAVTGRFVHWIIPGEPGGPSFGLGSPRLIG